MKNHLSGFHYSNIQKHQHGTKKTTRKVMIKKGKGYKSISIYKILVKNAVTSSIEIDRRLLNDLMGI